MPAQGTIKLSVLVAFRDRDLARVDRFLAGLDGQRFRSFELIFLDYGSAAAVAAELHKRVSRFSWARYVFNETTGMPWNRAHALNSAARQARGEYLLCTDIDLVYSQNALGALAEAAMPDAWVGASFYLLPKAFSDWELLAEGSFTAAPQSHANTLGAIQLVSREAFAAVRGFDEFFRIWGVEDFDFHSRLQRAGIRSQKAEIPPVYHQWHPSAAMPEMPLGWLEVMNFHSLTRSGSSGAGGEGWGRCLTAADRPALAAERSGGTARRFILPSEQPSLADFAAWKKIDFMRTLLRDLSAAAAGETFVCEIEHSLSIQCKEWLARTLFRLRYRPLAGDRFFQPRRDGRAILWYIIIFSGLVADYSIKNSGHNDRYTLVRA